MTDAITSDSLDPSIQIEWLQKRIAYLENLLQSNRIPFEGSISSQPAQSILPTTITPGPTPGFSIRFFGDGKMFSADVQRSRTETTPIFPYATICGSMVSVPEKKAEKSNALIVQTANGHR